jgi:membrane-associated two-gene conflict system component 1 (EACC1)
MMASFYGRRATALRHRALISRGARLDIQIRMTRGDTDDLLALRNWLSDEDELRGHVRVVELPISQSELGAVPELLTVALGAGGAGTVLASSLKTWLQSRRTSAKLTVQVGDRSVTLEIETLREVGPLLEQVLKTGDE